MSGRWTAELDAHARDCASCRDLRRVVDALRAPLRPAMPAIDASALWTCGRHARRISLEARISTIIALGQIGALGGMLVVLFMLMRAFDVWALLVQTVRTDVQISLLGMVSVAVVAVAGAGLLQFSRQRR